MAILLRPCMYYLFLLFLNCRSIMFGNDYRGIVLLLFLTVRDTSACANLTWLDLSTFGFVQSGIYLSGQSDRRNLSCQWQITDVNASDWMISIRSLNVELDRQSWTNELIFHSNGHDFLVNDYNQRTFFFPSTSHLQIDFPSKSPHSLSTTLNVQRFLLEFSRVPSHHGDDFHCQKSDLIIPRQWRCNCLHECGSDDFSDEDDCPLCELIQSSNNLLCHSNETWCLPTSSSSSGVCLSSQLPTPTCSYQIQCESVVTYAQDHGELLVKNSFLADRSSLCFVLMTKDKHQLELMVQQYDFLYQHPSWEYLIYDGDQQRSQILTSSKIFLTKQLVQTRGNHLATIVLRKRFPENVHELFDPDDFLLNITWWTSFCPAEQFLCNGHFERKCYTKQQRCDGQIHFLRILTDLFSL